VSAPLEEQINGAEDMMYMKLQDFLLRDRLISRVGDHLRGVTGGAVGDDC